MFPTCSPRPVSSPTPALLSLSCRRRGGLGGRLGLTFLGLVRGLIPGLIPGLILGLFLGVLADPARAQSEAGVLQEAAVLLGPESPAAAAGAQSDPALARGGDAVLAVWTDGRAHLGEDYNGNYNWSRDLYAQVLDAQGQPASALPFPLVVAPGDQFAPRVAWDGSAWLVLYRHQVPYGGAFRTVLRALRVGPDGSLLDAQALALADDTPGESEVWGLVGRDGGWTVVLRTARTTGLSTIYELKALRIAHDGSLVDDSPVLLAGNMVGQYGATAWSEGLHLCVWSTYVSGSSYGLRALLFDDSLVSGGVWDLVSEAGRHLRPMPAGAGGEFLLSWRFESDADPVGVVRSARVDAAGHLLPGEDLDVGGQLPRVVAADGGGWIVSWERAGLRAARVSAQGEVLDPGGVALGGLAAEDLSAAPGGGAVAAWTDDSAGGPQPQDVVAGAFDASLQVGTASVLSTGAPRQLFPDAVLDEAGGLLTHRSDISGEQRIQACPLGPGGTPSAADLTLAAATRLGAPRVANDGQRYLVIWTDPSTGWVMGRRLGTDGSILDPEALPLVEAVEADVAGREGVFLVTATGAARQPLALRLDGVDLSPLDASPTALPGSGASHPRVADWDAGWVCTWQRNLTELDVEIVGAMVRGDGQVGASFTAVSGLHLYQYYPYDYIPYEPTVAAAADTALVVWQDHRVNRRDWNVQAQRVLPDGTLLDGIEGYSLTTAPGNQGGAAVAFDGARFVTVWEDERFDTSLIDERSDLLGTEVGLDGGILEPEGMPVAVGDGWTLQPAVAGAGGSAAIYYSALHPEAPWAAYRLEMRRLLAPRSAATAAPRLGGRRSAVFSVAPNPANPRVVLRYRVETTGPVSLALYDARGRRVRTLVDGPLVAGEHATRWDGRGEDGGAAASGVYFYRLVTSTGVDQGKLTLAR